MRPTRAIDTNQNNAGEIIRSDMFWSTTLTRLLNEHDMTSIPRSLESTFLDHDRTVLLCLSCPHDPIRVSASQEVTRRLKDQTIALAEVVANFAAPLIFERKEAEMFRLSRP